MNADNVNQAENSLRHEVYRAIGSALQAVRELREYRPGEGMRAVTAERALRSARRAAQALGRVVERLEVEYRDARSAALDASPDHCDMPGPVCPEHGPTVVVIDGRNTCTRPGCELGATVPREDWDHCSAPAHVVITDADGSEELRVCRGHLVEARARLDGLRIVTTVQHRTPPDDQY